MIILKYLIVCLLGLTAATAALFGLFIFWFKGIPEMFKDIRQWLKK